MIQVRDYRLLGASGFVALRRWNMKNNPPRIISILRRKQTRCPRIRIIRIKHCVFRKLSQNQRLPGACNLSPGSKLLSITTQLHCGGHLGGRAQLPDTILQEDHPMTIPSKFGFN
jgi:hypothetical protein